MNAVRCKIVMQQLVFHDTLNLRLRATGFASALFWTRLDHSKHWQSQWHTKITT